VVHLPGGELPDLQERGVVVHEHADAIPRQELAAREVLLACPLTAAARDALANVVQLSREPDVDGSVLLEFFRRALDLRSDDCHLDLAARAHNVRCESW